MMLSYLLGSQDETNIPPPPEWVGRILASLTQEVVRGWLRSMGLNDSQYRITSVYRDQAHNARVGGAKNSAHMHGLAVDVVVNPASLRRTIVDAWPYGYAEDEGDHVHLNVSRRMGRMWVRAAMLAALGVLMLGRSG